MNSSESPYVSIIMPIYNEEKFIARSLQAAIEQTYPDDRFEVLVVDGMSADKTREIVQQIGREHSNVFLLDNPERIVSTALNIGLRHAKGEIIILVGGHCEIAPDYVVECYQALRNHPDVGVVGGALQTVGATKIAQGIAAAMSSPFGVGGVAFRVGRQEESLVDTVAFGAYRREIIDAAGPFDEELVRNQDDEYNYRLRKMNVKILFTPLIRARYHSRATLNSLWRQYYQYGFWKVRVLQRHPLQMRWRQFIPSVFVSALIGSALWTSFSITGRSMLIIVIAVYLLANLSASFIAFAQEKSHFHFLLPFIFVVLHFSYGFGFLQGLWHWRNRWRG